MKLLGVPFARFGECRVRQGLSPSPGPRESAGDSWKGRAGIYAGIYGPRRSSCIYPRTAPKRKYLYGGWCREHTISAALSSMAEPVEEPPAKKRKGAKGNPPGIFGDAPKLQARLPGFKVDGKACQKPIPGVYKDMPAALAAQATAQQKLAAGGPEAVWPNWAAPAERNKRSVVRRSDPQLLCLCSLRR